MSFIRVQTTRGCFVIPDPDDECAWCGDYRKQHNENGCVLCGRYPWEKGIYRCTGFVDKTDLAAREKRFIQDAGVEP